MSFLGLLVSFEVLIFSPSSLGSSMSGNLGFGIPPGRLRPGGGGGGGRPRA